MEFTEDVSLHEGVNYKIGLIWIEGTKDIFNVHETNNKLKYFNGSTWKTVELPL